MQQHRSAHAEFVTYERSKGRLMNDGRVNCKTARAAGTIVGGDRVIYIGNGVVAPAGRGSRWTGVALNDAITGERVAVETREHRNPLGAAAKPCNVKGAHREHPWRDAEDAMYWCLGIKAERSEHTPAEQVEHPAHYGGDTTYEVIKVAEAWGFDKDAYLFAVLKYIGRPGKGDYLTDLRKALFYLKRKIARMEAEAAAAEFAAETAERSSESHPEPGSYGTVGDWAGKGFTAAQTITGGAAGGSTVIHHPGGWSDPPEFHHGDGGRQLPPEFNAGNGRVMDGPARGVDLFETDEGNKPGARRGGVDD
jgi:hypothetical protein